jgi:hypothetical protein
MSFLVNVPNVPGVPSVNFAIPSLGSILTLLTADAISLLAGTLQLPWGIYFGPIPIIAADNVVAFEYDQEYDISDYPIEGGKFASYNKVYRPFNIVVRFSTGGPLIKRQAFLDSISAIIGDLNEYNVVTADAVYQSVNLVGYRYQQRAEAGVGLIQVDVMARQVQNAASAALGSFLSNTLNPASASQVNGGVVQPIAPSGQQSAFAGAIATGVSF